MSELKPCPFCGSTARVQEWIDGDSRDIYPVYYVTCESCGATSGVTTANAFTQGVRVKCIERVVERWNTRSDCK